MDWDSDDFQLPPLIELDDEEESMQHILPLEASLVSSQETDDSPWELQKCPSPPLHDKPVSNETIFDVSEETFGENFETVENSNDMELELQSVLECGEELPPNLEFLSRNLKPDDGKPRNLLAELWFCPDCEESHDPTRNLISDLQAYKCRLCQRQNHTTYSWSLTRVTLNGVSLDFSKTFIQIERRVCILYAFLALCDMMRRVRGAKRGWDEATPFDPVLMLIFYKETAGFELESLPDLPGSGGRHPHIEIMLEAAVMYGVPYSSITRFDHYVLKRAGQNLSVPKRTLKLHSWYKINHADVDSMTRLLAHGIPLLAVVPLGKCFEELPNGAIYHAPKVTDCYGKDPCVTHAVVIHGSAVAMPECDLSQPGDQGVHSEVVYFECRNSHGTKAHSRWDRKGEGADFYVWAADILGDVYAITLLDFDDY